ncbi:hypothetical protein LTR84_006903 [Exophiala bonariae]|uniref:Uncharacterized protein n=1 Tax=Exophiala bonariae TaxID=1690606 RepID=A0AAV9N074_9EURO|nr:hypothetical protein LTR84_006903 [Exophiala bonariae]
MSPPNRGRDTTTEQGNARQHGKRLPIETEARYTLMPVRDHQEPSRQTRHAPKTVQLRGLTTDARKQKEPVQIGRKAEATKAKGPNTATPKARTRADTVTHGHGKPSRHDVPRTEAIYTMMPVRDHKEPGQVAVRKAKVDPKPKEIPKKSEVTHRPLIRKESKKTGFWKALFGPQPVSPATLRRAETIGKDSRVKHEKSKRRQSLDASAIGDSSYMQDPSMLRRVYEHYRQGDSIDSSDGESLSTCRCYETSNNNGYSNPMYYTRR